MPGHRQFWEFTAGAGFSKPKLTAVFPVFSAQQAAEVELLTPLAAA
jgi:hypothetical protein